MPDLEEWTSAELARLHSLDAAGIAVAAIARELGRDEDAVRARLKIVRQRKGAVPLPHGQASAADLEWNGPDEEGDVPPPSGRADDDPAAWVHSASKD